MASTRQSPPILLAPGGSSGSPSIRLPARDEPWPDVDDHIVEPETRTEILNGRVLYALPAKGPHAELHFDLAAVLHAHVAPGYRGFVDMLTRLSTNSNFAPDASICPRDLDPVTGGRRLEELAFEIVSEQSISVATEKARVLAARGVRRIFCLVVKSRSAHEWSLTNDGWKPLSLQDVIHDVCLVRDLPVQALLDATVADIEVGRALVARGNPAVVEAVAQGEARGEAHGMLLAKREVLIRLLAGAGIHLTADQSARIAVCTDIAQVDAWLDAALADPRTVFG